MTTLIILIVLLINLLISFGLIGMIYFIAIMPLQQELKRLTIQPRTQNLSAATIATLPITQKPDVLPSMEDVPETAFYGDEEEEDVKSKYPTEREVEDQMTSNDPYSRLELDNNNAWVALKNLKSNAEETISGRHEVHA